MARPRRQEFADALAEARRDGSAMQPLCIGRWDEFTEYDEDHIPSEEQAAALCADCPLLEICRESTRKERPDWGVQGGVAWAYGRQAHLVIARGEDLTPRI